jgi:hypothetical protein
MGDLVDPCKVTPGTLAETWILSNADIIGLALLVLMVLLVVWRAFTRQAVTTAEAFIGVIGLIAIVLPVLSQFNLEFGDLKASGSIRQTQCDFAEAITQLQNKFAKIEADVQTVDAKIAKLANASPEEVGRQVSEIRTVPTADVVVIIYYLDLPNITRRDDATAAQAALADIGIQATIVATDFSEINRQLGSYVRVFATEKGKPSYDGVVDVLKRMFNDEVVAFDMTSKLSRGDIQIQIY